MTVGPYDAFSVNVGTSVSDAATAGKDLVADNFLLGMLVTGAFVIWRVGKRVIRSIV